MYVHTLDRLARNGGIQRRVLEALGKNNIGFATVIEGYDYTSPHQRFVLSVMGAVNDLTSDQIGVHVSKANRHRAEQGLALGPVPFGYRSLSPKQSPLPDGLEAEVLREAWRRRAAGESLGAIAAWLNESGFETREGNHFTAHAMKDIFNNRFYLGFTKYKGKEYTGQHEAIIDEPLFQAAQDRRGPGRSPRRVWCETGLLQGMISCGGCGNPLQSDRTSLGTPQYRERHAHVCATNGRSAKASPLDAQIATIVRSLELEPDWRERLAELVVGEYRGPSVAELQDRLRRLGVAFA
jgi:site-specific DNA recombinase